METERRGARSLYGKWRNAFAIVSAVLVGMALWIVSPSLNAYVRAESSLAAVQDYEALLVAFRAFSAERAPANVLMSVEIGSDPATITRLKEARRATDQALSVVDRMQILPLAPGTIHGLREQLVLARTHVDAIVAMPYGLRTREMMTMAIAAIFGVVDDLQPAVALAAETLEKKDPALAGSVVTALIATNLREQAGRLGSYIVPSVSRGLPLSTVTVDHINRTQGNIDQLMQMLGVRMDVSETNLRKRMGEVRRLFIGRGVRLIEKLTLEGRTGGHYSIAPAGLTGLYVPTLLPLEDLRKAAIRDMVADIVRNRDFALLQLVCIATFTVLLLFLLVLLMRRLYLSVLRPLLTAHEVIVGLAEEKSIGIKGFTADTQELNDLFDAIARLEGQLAERRELTERLRFQAETDPLTGLLNRGRFAGLGNARFAAATASIEGNGSGEDRIGVLYIDLDGFKAVNDTFGHFAGDELLREIGFRLSNVVGGGDLLARLGGDEFAICTSGRSRSDLEALSTRILLQFNQPIEIGGLPVKVGASLGIALLQEDGSPEARVTDFAQLCNNADMALYEAKRNGRNTYRVFGHTAKIAAVSTRSALAG